MRKVIYGAACSLDGFIAAADGSLDWLHFSKDVEHAIARTWRTIDTVLMGRGTWTAGREMSGGDAPPSMPGVATYVFSRTMTAVDVPGVTLVRDDAVEVVGRMKREAGRDICLMGGGVLAQSLFAAGLIDEVGLNVHPLLLGNGVPFFRDAGRRIPLELVENRTIDGGCVLATYRVRAG